MEIAMQTKNYSRTILTKLFLIITIISLNSGCAQKANLGDISKLSFSPTRIMAEKEVIIDKNAEYVFQLVSSVKMANNIYPWVFQISHLNSYDNEDHAIFSENFTKKYIFNKEGSTHWYTIKYSLKDLLYSAILIDDGKVYGRYDVTVTKLNQNKSILKCRLMYTALNKKGKDFIEQIPDNQIENLLGSITDAARLYSKKGITKPKDLTSKITANDTNKFTSVFYQSSAKGKVTGSADESFHMPGGVEELCWIPGWKLNLLYTDRFNGRTGLNTVFEESGPARLYSLRRGVTSYWQVVQYDKPNHEFQVVFTIDGDAVGRMSFKFEGLDDDFSIWNVQVTLASLTEKGSDLLKQGGLLYYAPQVIVQKTPDALIKYADYHKKTGKVYEISLDKKMKIAISEFWGSVFR